MTESTQSAQGHGAVAAETQGIFVYFGRRRVRLDWLLLAAILLLAGTVMTLFIVLDLGADDVERWGYVGLFGISLLRAASVLLPIPGSGMTFAAGGFLGPAWGIPGPLLVGVVAGFAESLGEFTGYGAGRSGMQMLNKREVYRRVSGWMNRRAFLTVFAMSLMPSLLFDVAGLVAGATRVPVRVFYPAMLVGKMVRGVAMATAGFYGISMLERAL